MRILYHGLYTHTMAVRYDQIKHTNFKLNLNLPSFCIAYKLGFVVSSTV